MPIPNPPAPKAERGSTAAKTRPAPAPAVRKPAAPPRKPVTTRRRSRAAGPRLSFAVPPDVQRELVGVALIVVALLLGLSLRSAPDAGLVGAFGSGLQALFGLAAWMVPLALFAGAIMLIIAGLRHIQRVRWEMPLGLLLIVVAVVGLMHLGLSDTEKQVALDQHLGGGFIGYQVSSILTTIAGVPGAAVVLAALILVGLMLAFQVTLGQLARLLGRGGQWLIRLFTEGPTPVITSPRPAPATQKTRPALTLNPAPKGRGELERPAPRSAEDDGIPADVPINGRRKGAPVAPLSAGLDSALRILGRTPTDAASAAPALKGPPPATQPPAPSPQPPTITSPAPLQAANEIARQLSLPTAGVSGMLWKLPDAGLLERTNEADINDGDLRDKAKKIEETLRTFGVETRVREINSGPAVTQFAIEPGEGVRVARIAALQNDLALALAAPSLRIEAPIPGQSRLGIEVPNVTPGLVGLRNILESEVFRAGKGKLKIPVGRDTHGQPIITDLTRLPHLLIAGATGSGKSVAINSLIISLIMEHTPDEIRFLMIDPKRVELSGFNGIPHLLRPVVTEMRPEREKDASANRHKGPREITAIEVLKWLLWEMERRYRLFARGSKDKEGTAKIYRNIDQYHQAFRANPGTLEPLPYIILIIDELADLMLVAPEDVETAVCRLAQLARATGIHLIIATQRPSVDVVTGLIKANFSARIAFAVTSMVDSRVILDQPGAEKLLGRGDALYTASDEAKPIRVQGTFVADKDTDKVITFWRNQLAGVPTPVPAPAPAPVPVAAGHPAPAADATPAPAPAAYGGMPEPDWLQALTTGDEGLDDDEQVLKDAIALVKRSKYASTSMLQRRLRIGYNRAARLIEQMEEMGIVGPADGSRPRQVLVTADSDGPEPGAGE